MFLLVGLLAVPVLTAGTTRAGMCGMKCDMSAQEACAAETKSAALKSETKPVEVDNEYCPVMGNKIEKGEEVKYTYKNKIYNFCCPDCIKQFKKDPKKYIKKIEESKKKEKEEKHHHSH